MSPLGQIPILDLQPQIQAHWDDFNKAFQRVLCSGQFILGPEEQAFEAECASYLGVRHAIGLNSGTDALYIALRSLGVGPGDEVITTPFTFFATAEAITHVGATPVFVDIEEDSFNVTAAAMAAAVTDRTKALLPVHLFGRPCEMDSILELGRIKGLPVVEDCAQSFGASWGGKKVGSLGILGCLSFFPTKNLNAFGDAGMLTTDDDDLAAQARMLRVHGSRKKYFNETAGYNSRLDELQAAMLRVKLPQIDHWNEGRRRIAARYRELLAGVPNLVLPLDAVGHIYHQFTVRIQNLDRDAFQAALGRAGIGTMVYYPVPVHRLKLYLESHGEVKCPVAERFSDQVLSLPIWPEMNDETLEIIVAAIKKVMGDFQ